MKVYVLTEGAEFESEYTLAIFSTKEKAYDERDRYEIESLDNYHYYNVYEYEVQ